MELDNSRQHRALSNWSSVSGEDSDVDADARLEGSLVVFSGGTAFNSTASILKKYTSRVAYVLPVSDDGGSTRVIIDVLGGPAVGDIRSRCLRLSNDRTPEGTAVRNLLAHRLDPENEDVARHEWLRIVEGSHTLWANVGDPYKHTIRAFLVHFQAGVLGSREAGKFTYTNGSIGNFFFAGARTFFNSMEAAIFMYHRVSGVATRSDVLPVIVSERRITIAAELESGEEILGQNEISHPSTGSNTVSKEDSAPMSSPVSRIFYLSSDGDHETAPQPNPAVLQAIGESRAIVYGMGSLYTSIAPCLVLPGMGEAIAAVDTPKILLLNSTPDRESGDLPASGFVKAITKALNRKGSRLRHVSELDLPPSAYITRVVYAEGSKVHVDVEELEALGIEVSACKSVTRPGKSGHEDDYSVLFDNPALCELLVHLGAGED